MYFIVFCKLILKKSKVTTTTKNYSQKNEQVDRHMTKKITSDQREIVMGHNRYKRLTVSFAFMRKDNVRFEPLFILHKVQFIHHAYTHNTLFIPKELFGIKVELLKIKLTKISMYNSMKI